MDVSDVWDGPTLDQRFDPQVAERLVIPVDAVVDDSAALWFVDPIALADHGFETGPYGLMTAEQEAALHGATILRRAKDGETPAHQVMATRYFDFADSVQGDGRAGILGRPLMHRTGGDETPKGRSALLRVKGIATGAIPKGQTEDDSHGHGHMDVRQAFHDAVHQLNDYLNGIESPRSVAFAGTDTTFRFRATKTNQWRSATKGYLVECGRFDRAAHLLAMMRNDGPANFVPEHWTAAGIRSFLDDINEQVELELGRKAPLSMRGLFAHLNKRKAVEVADRYWMRTQQGSPTYDNIAFLQCIDHGTVQAQDRTHPHQGNSHVSDGFSGEPEQIFSDVVATYFSFFSQAATRKERKQLAIWQSADVRRRAIEGPFDRRMARNALLHLGLCDSEVATLFRSGLRNQSVAFARLLREIGETPEPGVVHELDKLKVENPARYDVFSGLAELVNAVRSDDPAKRLAKALRPLVPDATRDEAVAQKILDAAQPLLDAILVGDERQQKTKALMMSDLARRINEPSAHLYATVFNRWRDGQMAKLEKGDISKVRFRAEIQAYARRGVRKGACSPTGVVDALKTGTMAPNDRGVFTLASIPEHGALVEEISTGDKHGFRFRIGGDLLELGDLSRYRAKFETGDGKWQTLEPSRIEDGEPVFETLGVARPKHVSVVFFDAENPKKVWDLDGRGFGGGHRPLQSSDAVRIALAEAAGVQPDLSEPPLPVARAKAVRNAMVKHGVPPDRVLEHARELAGFRWARGTTTLTEQKNGFAISKKTKEETIRLVFDYSGDNCRVSLTMVKNTGKKKHEAQLAALDFPTGRALREG